MNELSSSLGKDKEKPAEIQEVFDTLHEFCSNINLENYDIKLISKF